jgi:16S rRNA (cytidine1402-2'-O)-methyltransferase
VLYLVPTPIGNLEDITLRALRVLREADLVACEDTRTAGFLLSHYDIDTPRTSYHDHNERQKAPELVARMQGGATIALVTDAGSPGISDPGFYLVRECLREGVPVEALPGATAFVPALTLSGLPTERFAFEGFLPAKKGRQTRLEALAEEARTLVLYESPHRILRTLDDLAAHLGPDRPAAAARELTKKFEEVVRGTLAEVRAAFADREKVRGELVVVVGGAEGKPKRQRPSDPA